jgi:hypothetical protein
MPGVRRSFVGEFFQFLNADRRTIIGFNDVLDNPVGRLQNGFRADHSNPAEERIRRDEGSRLTDVVQRSIQGVNVEICYFRGQEGSEADQ